MAVDVVLVVDFLLSVAGPEAAVECHRNVSGRGRIGGRGRGHGAGTAQMEVNGDADPEYCCRHPVHNLSRRLGLIEYFIIQKTTSYVG